MSKIKINQIRVDEGLYKDLFQVTRLELGYVYGIWIKCGENNERRNFEEKFPEDIILKCTKPLTKLEKALR